HNYGYQTNAMQRGMKRVCDQMDIDLRWTIVNKGGKGTHAIIDLYDNPKWADEFDVVIHNECFAKTNDADYIRKITTPHKKGTPAVVIHCAMHTYRDAKIDDWRQFLGVTSRRHDHQSRYPVKTLVSDHVVMKGFPADYVSQKDELYIIEKLWPSATALATSESEKSGKAHPVIWVNQYGKARVFGTTYGHSDETFGDDAFLQLLSRGTLWAAGAL
ncbi:MAG: ThuA domain-containing protein, partial [Planctomycetota bacterium]